MRHSFAPDLGGKCLDCGKMDEHGDHVRYSGHVISAAPKFEPGRMELRGTQPNIVDGHPKWSATVAGGIVATPYIGISSAPVEAAAESIREAIKKRNERGE